MHAEFNGVIDRLAVDLMLQMLWYWIGGGGGGGPKLFQYVSGHGVQRQ